MGSADLVDRSARWLTLAAGLLFVAVGAIFFVLPGPSADGFPWRVSPFVAMTIGGWAIGTGLVALDAARRWDLPRVYPALVFLWVFSLLELWVTVAFLGVLRTDQLLTWPYLLALVTGAAAAIPGAVLLWRSRAAIMAPGERLPGWVRFFEASFILVVGFLAVSLLLRDASVEGRAIFPEPLTLFTVRAFCAFFFALVVGAASLLPSRDVRTAVTFAQMGLYLIIPITIAAFANLGVFDFSARPGGLIYIGLYLLTATLAIFSLLWYRQREAIDGLPVSADGRRDAIAELLAADTMPVPSDPSDIRRELDEAHETDR